MYVCVSVCVCVYTHFCKRTITQPICPLSVAACRAVEPHLTAWLMNAPALMSLSQTASCPLAAAQ